MTCVGSGVRGVPGLEGASVTTASGTGLPSLSTTITCSAPARAAHSVKRFMGASRPDDVPDLQVVVAVLVAGLLVFRPCVHGLALVGPLAAAIVAHDDRVGALRRVARCGQHWRPLHRASVVA